MSAVAGPGSDALAQSAMAAGMIDDKPIAPLETDVGVAIAPGTPVVVVGAGLMGAHIGLQYALAGHPTTLGEPDTLVCGACNQSSGRSSRGPAHRRPHQRARCG